MVSKMDDRREGRTGKRGDRPQEEALLTRSRAANRQHLRKAGGDGQGKKMRGELTPEV